MMLTTWNGEKWYVQFYDMDTMLGLDNTGFKRFGPDVDMLNGDYNTSNSKLWTMFQRNFASQIRARYIKLRTSGKLSVESIVDAYITKVISKIGQKYYNLDMLAKYIPYKNQYIHMLNGSREEFTKRWITERFIYMDSIYSYGNTVNKFCTIRSNVSGTVHLRIKTYSPQMVTVSFSGAQGNIQTLKCTKDSWTTFTGFISTERDNEINISNAGQIMYLDGIKDLYPSVLLLGEATKLVELDCSNSPYMRTLELSTNYLLQKVNCSNCEMLGDISSSGNPQLDVSSSVNLKYLDCSNTKFSIIKFNTNGGALNYLNCSNTLITDFTIVGQEFLKEINLANCNDLSRLSIKNCSSLENLLIPNSRLESFTLEDCTAIKTLDLSNTQYLEKVDLINCPNLEKLTLKSLINNKFTQLDLSTCANLKLLDVTGCLYLTYIRFSRRCTNLSEFYASQSAIKGVKFGAGAFVDEVDLTSFNLTDIDFRNCTNLQVLRFLNMTPADGSAAFENCFNLKEVTGSIILPKNSSHMFSNCEKLVDIPNTFDFSNVKDASEIFVSAGINTKSFEKVIASMTSVENLYLAFYRCPNITYTEDNPLPDTIFENCTNLQTAWGTLDDTNIYVKLTNKMFANNTNLKYLNHIFPSNSIHGEIPYDLFKNNLKLESIISFFASNYITKLPNNLFKSLTELSDLTNCFSDCSNMTVQLTNTMFEDNAKLKKIDHLFSGCSQLTGSIPAQLFTSNTLIDNADAAFKDCSSLTGSIPESLFSTCKGLKIVSRVFSNCTGLTGDIPLSIFDNNNNITTCESLFEGCENLTFANNEFPNKVFQNKYQLININAMFKECSSLIFTLKSELFKDCRALTNISYLFEGCRGLSGSIPEKLFIRYDADGTEITTSFLEAEGVFRNCVYLTGEIPYDIMYHFNNVQSINRFFEHCENIVGEIPPALLRDCSNLISARFLFSNTSKLGKYQVKTLIDGQTYTDAEKEDSYFIASNFLSYSPKLEDIGCMFFGWPNGSGLKGSIPPKFFSYCPDLVNIDSTFDSSGVSGSLVGTFFINNPKLEDVSGTFKNGNYNKIEPNLFTASKNPNITNFNNTFSYCYNITGVAPELWKMYPNSNHTNTFTGDNNLTNYASIPDTWK